MRQASAFDPDILKVLQTTFDETWACLQPKQQVRASPTTLAVRMLELAAAGHRDSVRLRSFALTEVAASAV
jgi:hypothetical protein